MTTEIEKTAIELLRELERSRFYGAVEIKFEAGRIALIRKTETIKLANYRENRGQNEQQHR